MPLKYPLVNVSEDLKHSNFLTPISKAQGSSTTAFYSILEPGKPSKVYKHNNCDVISILLKGSGVFGIGKENISAAPGDCGYVTKGTKHFFYNTWW